ncbi:transposable element Tcb2 transposase [Trichonephila clavipes]|nr:transposable element Tcb2 transposase [Trichonephila clavipes]
MVCIPLTPRHHAARRRWAAEHGDWEQHYWSQVLFTDESQFSLESDTRRVLVWRDRGTRNNPHSFVKDHNREELVGWYADEILRPYVIPCAVAIGDSFVFQDDNARPHRARLVENMLEAETIQRREWPACSPDLNSIEHVWDMLGRRIAARPRPPATVRDLEIALLEEWNIIPQSLIDNLIASMANSVLSVTPSFFVVAVVTSFPGKFLGYFLHIGKNVVSFIVEQSRDMVPLNGVTGGNASVDEN